jgi:hypothetical protein
VPGRKFATVSPAPASMKRRREMLRFVMTSSLEMSAFSAAVGSMLGRQFPGRNHGATLTAGDARVYFNAAMVASVATRRNAATSAPWSFVSRMRVAVATAAVKFFACQWPIGGSAGRLPTSGAG